MNGVASILEKDRVQELDANNPIIIKDDTISSVKDQLLKVVLSASKEQNLTKEETEALVKVILEVYMEHKAKFFLESKLNTMRKTLSNLSKVLVNPTKTKDSTDLYYYSHSKHSFEK